MVEVAVLKHRLDVEQAGGHFHRQRCRRGGAGRLALVHCLLQASGKCLAQREQPLERIAHERELLRQAGQPVHLASSHGRPGLLCSRNALAGLGDPGRVELTQRAVRIIDRLVMGQTVNVPHGRQAGRPVAFVRGGALGAEEQQVLGKALGDFTIAALQHPKLRKQARRHPLGKHVGRQQPARLRLKDSGRQLPQSGAVRVCRAGTGTGTGTSTQAGTDLAHAGRGQRWFVVTHQLEQLSLQQASGGGVGVARSRLAARGQVGPAPVHLPQVGRVNAVGAGDLEHGTVLGEHRQRRHRLARQHARQVVEQRERCTLDVFNGGQRHRLWLGDKSNHRGFAGAKDRGRSAQPDQFEGADTLMDLDPRATQDGRVDHVDIRGSERFGFLQVASQRLVRILQRAAQFVMHPRQRAEVVDGFAHLVVHPCRRSLGVLIS